MKRTQYDVAIIGAGHNGLICGAYLARTGLRVCILEARHECGGGLDTLETGGFRYNLHAVYHMMAERMPAYSDLDLKRKGVAFVYPEVQAAYINKQEKPLILYKDPRKTAEYISATYSAADGERYLRMFRDFEEYSEKIVMPLTYVPAVPPIEQVQILNQASDNVGRRFNEVAELTPIELLDEYGFAEPLNAAILNLFAMWGLSPEEALGYLFPLYVYRMTNAALCRGGSHRLSSGLHRAVLEASGEIIDSAEVTRVMTENGRVTGVVTRDGLEIKAQVVVSSADPKQSFCKFFQPDEVPPDIAAASEVWEWEKSTMFGVHLGLKQAPRYIGSENAPDANQAMITFLGLDDTESLLEHCRSVEDGHLPEKRYGHTTVASLFDPIMAPPGLHSGRFEAIVPFDCDWDAIAKDYGQACIAEWKEYAPNLEPIRTYTYPPTYIEKKILSMVRGSIKHGAYIPLQMGSFRPNIDCSQGYTPIDGYYLCGASTYPGGMVIGGPGYIAANMIADDLGVKKTWAEPDMVQKAKQCGLIAE